jgi:hypothetical protein
MKTPVSVFAISVLAAGKSIIAAAKTTNQVFEKVESLKDDKLVIAAGFLDRRFRYFIDLRKLDFEKEEAVYPDRGATNFYVLPHGRLSERQGGPILDFQIPIQP